MKPKNNGTLVGEISVKQLQSHHRDIQYTPLTTNPTADCNLFAKGMTVSMTEKYSYQGKDIPQEPYFQATIPFEYYLKARDDRGLGCPAPGDGAHWDAEGSRIREDFNYTESDYVADMGFEACTPEQPTCLPQKGYCDTLLTPQSNNKEDTSISNTTNKPNPSDAKESESGDSSANSNDIDCEAFKKTQVCPAEETGECAVTAEFLQSIGVKSTLFTWKSMRNNAIYKMNLNDFVPHLTATVSSNGIRTCYQKAHFIAQTLHETARYQSMIEGASGEAYNGRSTLGNDCPADGPRFKGRRLIQLTGRYNYWRAKVISNWNNSSTKRPRANCSAGQLAADSSKSKAIEVLSNAMSTAGGY